MKKNKPSFWSYFLKSAYSISPKKLQTEIFLCKHSGDELVLSPSCIRVEMVMRILKIWGLVFLPLVYLLFDWSTPNERFLIALKVTFAFICIVTVLEFLVFQTLSFEKAESKKT